ncbi:hypothetical protein VN24_19930 [Paenibacillus beijingensis]|uniref:Uncharacterized protein n=1 Tax=Paenibacillus beijingensis TaxID=1126833 RepID=A0A0D5NNB9_9BACL|nr:hypothetical protein VN24_19930 [Paenibacillus beijingensis]
MVSSSNKSFAIAAVLAARGIHSFIVTKADRQNQTLKPIFTLTEIAFVKAGGFFAKEVECF